MYVDLLKQPTIWNGGSNFLQAVNICHHPVVYLVIACANVFL
jgi:hypothetical protein